MAKKKITQIAAEELEGFLRDNGYELYSIEFVKEAKDWFLRVYIDWDQGGAADGERYISTDDCEKVSRYLSERLDELDPIENNYYLEVSSPGLDRALLKEEDYRRYSGKEVDVSLYKAVDGRKAYSGILKGMADGIITISENGTDIEFPAGQVAKTKLRIVF